MLIFSLATRINSVILGSFLAVLCWWSSRIAPNITSEITPRGEMLLPMVSDKRNVRNYRSNRCYV